MKIPYWYVGMVTQEKGVPRLSKEMDFQVTSSPWVSAIFGISGPSP